MIINFLSIFFPLFSSEEFRKKSSCEIKNWQNALWDAAELQRFPFFLVSFLCYFLILQSYTVGMSFESFM